ncbi:MAG: DUF2489 domain-containing protein [Porticoccaceae bacterium]
MSILSYLVIAAAATVLIVLVAYAIYLYLQLRTQKIRQRELEREYQSRRLSELEQAQKNIVILARALLGKDVSLTEACIRIAYLMNQVRETLDSNTETVFSSAGDFTDLVDLATPGNRTFHDIYPEHVSTVFFQVAEASAHIPILEAWGKLSYPEQLAYDRERIEIEAKFEEFVLVAVEQVLEQS